MPFEPERNIESEHPYADQSSRRVKDARLCRAMVNSIVDYAVILTDPEGTIISLNKGAELILGYKEGEVLGKSISLFYPFETLKTDSPIYNLQEALINNNYQINGWRLKQDGTIFFANIHYTALYDEDKELLGYTKIIYDLTGTDSATNGGIIKHEPGSGNLSFRKLIENSYSGISLLDANMNVIYRSPSAERIGGWNNQDRAKYGVADLIHPDDIATVQGLLDEALTAPGVPKAGSFRTKHADGGYIWLDCVFSNFLDEPNVNAIVCNFIDSTERRLNQSRVAEREKFIKTITDNVPAMIAYWDARLKCLFANKPYCNWFEKTATEIIGMNKAELMSSVGLEELHGKIEGVLSGSAQSFERTFVNKSGAKIYTHTQYIPDISDDTVKGFYSIIYDITEVKIAEGELRAKNEQIADLLENIQDGFIALDEHMCYTYANKTVGTLLGMPTSALIGRNIWEVFPDAVGSKTYEAIMEAYSSNVYVSNEDYYPPLNLWQENRVYPSGKGVSVFIRDITERKVNDLQKNLLAGISAIFNEEATLKETLFKVLNKLAHFGNFKLVEAWLVSADKRKINLAVNYCETDEARSFYKEGNALNSFVKGEGLPGMVWETKAIQFVPNLQRNDFFLRKQEALRAGITSAYGAPIIFKGEVIGVMVLGLSEADYQESFYTLLFERFSRTFGAEICRKQVEQELNQIFNLAPDLICSTGIDGYFKKVNPAMVALLGYPELELLNRQFVDFIHADDKERSLAQFNKILEGEATPYFECRFETRDHKTKWLAWTTSAPSEDGLIFCVAKDITEKKELEDLLAKANSMARIGSWEFDLSNGNIYWSDVTREIHEVGGDFIPDLDTGINFYKEGESRKVITAKVKAAIEKGVPWDTELQIITAQGYEKWVRSIGEAEFSGGRCMRLYGSFQDIDARKRAEIAVSEILEERNVILESIGDAFFAVGKNWVITYWNNMAEKVLGKPKQMMLNSNLWDVFNESVNSKSYHKYHEAIETNKAIHFEDFYAPLQKWYEISAYPSAAGLSVYFKDITERKVSDKRLKELNESLKRQTKELTASNAELEQFAYVASHDLQEPLRMVTGFLSQIERKYSDKLDEKGIQYINFAVDGAKRMRQIILDLLEFSRIGTTADNIDNVDAGSLINDILAFYNKLIDGGGATVLFKDLPVLRTYRGPLRQVFQNLISNSLKYNEHKTDIHIEIKCAETDGYWQFSVADNGIGIEPQYFDKIFVIFQRLHNKDKYSGTGMGLAIAKKIVENLGGKIWVESVYGQGSTFYFTIKKTEL
ncbi:PAS domain S-box protein [Mucilaginibacter celer]|uniref:histidine kinase n=1 Tax=Mucilaginibacter celer TaxID=2305508 RepID=A0A494VUP8_9SPHI|nr:PAS domain S-box protein [Mucilaginibacter celer]AYL95153.1 PAS domain S-box protein [Mucilaginibacter celer]